MLELKHISKRFEEHLIIDDVSLVLPDCGTVGIQGTSGCGKSTLLYIIGMLDDDFEGEIFYNGEKVTDRSEFISQNISYMMQNKDFISALTIKENITLASQVSQFDYSPAILQKITTQLSIQDLLKRYPHQLSGGQLKRASIAKAMLKQSPIILCDEPTGALDSNTSRDILVLLEQINQKYGTTMLIVTHNNSIKNMVHQVIRIKDGMIRECYENETRVPAAELEDL